MSGWKVFILSCFIVTANGTGLESISSPFFDVKSYVEPKPPVKDAAVELDIDEDDIDWDNVLEEGSMSRTSLFHDFIPRTLQNELLKQDSDSVQETNGRGIIGGDFSEKGKRNYQVSLQLYSSSPKVIMFHFCGASVIDEQWILTAAHCLDVDYKKQYGLNNYKLFVVAGEYNTAQYEGDEKYVLVDKSFIHPEYGKDKDYQNDIGLIKTNKVLNFTDYVRKIPLPYEYETSYGKDCVVSGWGDIDIDLEYAVYPEKLREVTVKVRSDEECESSCDAALPKYDLTSDDYDCTILQTAMCAGSPNGLKDSCQGDSGGPLACKQLDGSYYQAGVVSYGLGCGLPGMYGVYTEISYYLDWIDTVMATETDGSNDDGSGATKPVIITSLFISFNYLLTVFFK